MSGVRSYCGQFEWLVGVSVYVLDDFDSEYPWTAIPKMHLMRHIKDGLLQWNRNISCMSGERLHRRTKVFGRFAFRQWQETIMVRTLVNTVEALKKKGRISNTPGLKASP